MLFALFITVFSFKIIRSNQETLPDTTKSVVIKNSNFQSRQFSNANSNIRSNKLTNALVSNSNFKFKGSKDHSLLLQLVNFNNNTIELDEDFESSPVEVQSGQSTIFNLTLKNLKHKDNDVAMISFDESDVKITKLQFKGKLMATLFKGTVKGFTLTESTIENFEKDNKHQIRSAIFLSHIECSDTKATFHFENNVFQNNKIPVFELDKNINNNVTISKSTFYHNEGPSGSCILISYQSGARNTGMINIQDNRFNESANSGSGTVGGALKVNTQQTVFTGNNYFYKNDVYTEGSQSTDLFGGYGASIYLTQSRLQPYSLANLHFESDSSSHGGGSIFIYAYDESGQTQDNTVTIENCDFTRCKSDQLGGAICSGIQKSNGEAVGTNDVVIKNCVFNSCEAGTGGAIYVSLGTGPGGESTKIDACHFTSCKCNGRQGSAIFSGSIEFTMTGSDFKQHGKADDTDDGSIIGLSFKDKNSKSLISKCTFTDCHQAILKMPEDSDKTNPVHFEECIFDSNKVISKANTFRGLLDLSYLNKAPLSLTSCNFTNNEGFCVLAEKGICKTTFNNCKFQKNIASQYGCIFYATRSAASDSQEYLVFIDSTFIDHEYTVKDTGRATGVLHAPLSFVRFDGTNTFKNNHAKFTGTSTSKQNCAMGGSILFEASSDKDIVISNLVFEDCSADNYGGAIAVYYESSTGSAQVKLSFTFENCQFKNCSSNIGGAIYLDNNDKVQYELGINRCTFNECSAPTGCSLYCQVTKLDMSHSVFDKMTGGSSLFYVNINNEGAETRVTNCSFINNCHRIEFGSSSSDLPKGSSITFTKCTFKDNKAPENQGGEGGDGGIGPLLDSSELPVTSLFDLTYVKSETISFDACTFDHNGYQCISQSSDIISDVHFDKCIFSNNYDYPGCAICAMTCDKNRKMIVENCQFLNNIAKPNDYVNYISGCVIAFSNSIEFKGINNFKGNEVYGKSDEYEGFRSFGGSLFIVQDEPEEYVISNLIIENSYSQHYGGGMAIWAGDFDGTKPGLKSEFVRVENCQFINCSSGKQGGAIRCGFEREDDDGERQYDNDVNISHCTFTRCKSKQAGALYFQDGDPDGDEETIIQYCKFYSCIGYTGSAIICQSYKFELSHSIFTGSSKYEGEYDGKPPEVESFLQIFLNEAGIQPVITNCTFTEHEQNIEVAVLSISPAGATTHADLSNTITFNKCTFSKNNKDTNEIDTVLDLQYIVSELVTFENCLFSENGGQVISVGEGTTMCNSYLKNCTFDRNHGGQGCALYLLESEYNNEKRMTVENCTFSNNNANVGYGEVRAGVIYADTLAINFAGVNYFSDNTVKYSLDEGQQYDDGEEATPAAEGGALLLYQYDPAEYRVTNLIFNNCNVDGYGGAIMIYAGDIDENPDASKSLFFTVENCTFNGCTAGRQGGAIKCGTESGALPGEQTNDVNITNCQFIACSAPEGGALYFKDGTEEGDEETVIQYCIFDGCSGFAGSAILCGSYKFDLSHTIIKGSRQYNGDKLSRYETQSVLHVNLNEDGITPVVANCTFIDNEQCVEFYSSNAGIPGSGSGKSNSITFKNCNITKNNKFQSSGIDSIFNLEFILSETLTFDECLFEENEGQCIKQESDVTCNTIINKCRFNNNHGMEGACIFAIDHEHSSKATITVKNCIFTNNKATMPGGSERGAAICAETLTLQFEGVNEFHNNIAGYSGPEIENAYNANGGSIFINQNQPAEYRLSNLIFTNSYSNGYGGAITLWCGDMEENPDKPNKNSLFITLNNCTFTNCTSHTNGGALKCGGTFRDFNKNNDVKITNCKFNQCRSVSGGALYFVDGNEEGDEETVIQHCTFDGCVGCLGSALYCRSYKFELSHSIFCNLLRSNIKKPEDEETPEIESFLLVMMNEAGVSPQVTNCTLYNNEQGIVFIVAGASQDGSINEIVFKKCNITKNAQEDMTTGGIFDFEFILATSITIEDCTFEENGGRCISHGNDAVTDSYINNCKFIRNNGYGGCAISATNADVEGIHKMHVKGCTFANNSPTKSEGANSFGAVVAFSNSIEFLETNTFENNENIYGSDVDDMYRSFGGSLVIVQSDPEEYVISGLVFKNSYSKHNGGAIGILGGDFKDHDESKKHLFVKIVNCQFTNCTAGLQGGAIRCGLESESDFGEEIQFDNDVNISHCTFTKCQAPKGGALYFQDGDFEGDEETVIEYCNFDACNGTSGSALYCQSYKFECSHSTFENSVPTGQSTGGEPESFFFINLNEAGVSPTITDCTFNNNGQAIYALSNGPVADEDNPNTITFRNCHFTKNNQEISGIDSILDLQYIQATNVKFDSCIFEENYGRCVKLDEGGSLTHTEFTKCEFKKNHGLAGCAIYTVDSNRNIPEIMIVIKDCNFSYNKPTQHTTGEYYGAVVAYSKCIDFQGTNIFDHNEVYSVDNAETEDQMAFGGSLTILQDQPEEYEISGIVFKNSYSQHYGGAINIRGGDYHGEEGAKDLFVRITNCQFTNCTSGKQGGAIRCGFEVEDDDGGRQWDNDVNISHCTFTKCKAPEAGALYFQDGDEEGDEETIVEHCIFEECSGSRGSAILCRSYKFSLLHSQFIGSRQVGNTAPGSEIESFLFAELNEDGVTIAVTNCTFYDNEQNIEFYSINAAPTTLEDKQNRIVFKDCNFTKNNQESNSADTILDLQYILSEQVTFENCLFEQNGGRSISQENEVVCSTHIKGCKFNNNHGGSGNCIYALESSFNEHPYITVEDCSFTNNRASFMGYERGGAIYAQTLSLQFAGTNTFTNNEASPEYVEPGQTPGSLGGSIFIAQTVPGEYRIPNLIIKNSYSAGYGGAIHIFAGDAEGKDDPKPSSLFITLENCKFENCSAGAQGGAIRMGDPQINNPDDTKDNDINVSGCSFIECKAPEGGALYFMDGDVEGDEETIVEYCTFDKCIGSTGSAIYCQSYKFECTNSNFLNSRPTGTTGEMSEIESILFIYLNEAGIKPVIKNCTFTDNEQNIEVQSHGPIAIEGGPESSITFLGCFFTKNNQESNGDDSILDLEHIQSQTVTFENCIFERNAGHCIMQQSEYVCNTLIKNCDFNFNHGGAGCAIYSATTRSDNIPMMTVDGCRFANNTVTSAWGARGGAVCASTITILFIGVNQFIGNKVIYEASQERASSVPNIYVGACGGALYIIQESELRFELRDVQFSECQSEHYGGAIAIAGLEDENLFSRLHIDIIGCKFSKCKSTYGGAIGSTIEGLIKCEACQFDSVSSESGGAIYCNDESTETPSSLEVKGCSFNNIKASDIGGAIYCHSGAVSITYNNFTNCEARSKGAVMYVAADVNATFEKNNIENTKKNGVTAIYYTSSNDTSTLYLDGGCYSINKQGHDNTADVFIFETNGKIEFKNKPCFSGSKEQSIQVIGNAKLDLPDEYFNCHECEAIVVPPTPTFTIPTYLPSITPSYGPSNPDETFLPTEDINGTEPDDSGSKKKKGLSTGAIVGIIIGVVVVVAAIIVLVIFLMRSRVNRNDIRSEQISQDADNSAYALESRMSTNEDENQPIWAANSMDANNIQENVDPFMKDFEEAVV